MASIVLFAGAGASRAVNQTAYPTTVEFYQQLPSTIIQQSIFKLTIEYLRARRDDGAKIDIELVLWALQELDAFISQAGNAESVPGWFLRENRLASTIGGPQNFSGLLESGSPILPIIRDTISRIDELVYDFYGRMPQEFELQSNWLPLLEGLLSKHRHIVEIFTTNYDVVLEAALAYIEERERVPEGPVVTGRREGIRPTLDPLLWGRPPWSGHTGLLTKLHGSVDWSRGASDIYVGDPLFKGNHEKHVILYPGFKGLPAAEPFAAFHNYLARAVAGADIVLFIGFAFRDAYINDILNRWTAPHVRLFAIDIAKTLSDAPFSAGRLHHLAAAFNGESVNLMLNTLEISGVQSRGA